VVAGVVLVTVLERVLVVQAGLGLVQDYPLLLEIPTQL
jgi:hypothetical protein